MATDGLPMPGEPPPSATAVAGQAPGVDSPSHCTPVRTSSFPTRIVGFATSDTSPMSVLAFRSSCEGSPTLAHQHHLQDQALLAKALKAERALPRLQINTDKKPGRGLQLGALKKCKSHADLRRPPSPGTARAAAALGEQQSSAPNSPLSRTTASSEPVRIPLDRLSRLRAVASASQLPLLVKPTESPPLGAASTASPARRAGSLAQELFTAHADVVTVQAQVDSLHGALLKEREEVSRLREALQSAAAECDQLRSGLGDGDAVFAMDEGSSSRATPSGAATQGALLSLKRLAVRS